MRRALSIALIAGAVLGVAIQFLCLTTTPAPAAQRATESTVDQRVVASRAPALRAELDALNADRERLVQQRRILEAQTDAIGSGVNELAAAEDPWDVRVAAVFPLFVSDRHRDVLERINWAQVATALTGVRGALEQMLVHIESGVEGPPSPELVGAFQRFNGPLATAAVTAHQGGIAGSGANGSYTHPLVMANAMAARLEATATPFTPEQRARLQRLLDAATATLAKEVTDDPPLALEAWLRDLEIRRAFLNDVDELLTSDQQTALRPQAVRHRMGLDLFSEGLIALGHVQPVPFRDRADLAQRCARLVNSRLQVPSGEQAAATEIVTAWVEGLPEDHLRPATDRLSKVGHFHVDRVRNAARDQLLLLRRLDRELTLDETSRQLLRDLTTPLLPQKRTK